MTETKNETSKVKSNTSLLLPEWVRQLNEYIMFVKICRSMYLNLDSRIIGNSNHKS